MASALCPECWGVEKFGKQQEWAQQERGERGWRGRSLQHIRLFLDRSQMEGEGSFKQKEGGDDELQGRLEMCSA